jgi:uncharacterized DUF497 family protein
MRLQDIEGFRWPRGIEEKVFTKHGLSGYEVDDAFFRRAAKVRRTGERFLLLSTTGAGAYIIVYFEYAADEATILTAREMTTTERQRYKRK